jgi:DUF1680 family protein
MKHVLVWFFALGACAGLARDYPIRSVEMSKVKVTGGFWLPRIETNRLVTLKTDFAKCNETPRIANFTNCAARAKGLKFGGIFFDDSDVYKVMEGAAYIYATSKDPELKKYMDWLISQVGRAQEADGYLYTARTLGGHKSIEGTARWEALFFSHELYNVGHMYEAAVAWYQATGERNFLDIAIKNADLICRTFGPGKGLLKLTSGHQEIELALCKLYRVTGEQKYLDMAKFFIDMRGAKQHRQTWGVSVQDHAPVLEQTEALGHAVRAGYMYAGMADIAALTGEQAYIAAIDRLWENVVGRKLHLSGGIGAGKKTFHPKWGAAQESFGVDYELPNETAYLETCAAIANALWNQRMFLWKGEAKFVDVIERILYNGFLSGISLSGDTFFYENPLAATAKRQYKRAKWFGCSCCPVNDVRFIPQIPTFAYATDGKDVFVNLFMESEADINGVNVKVETRYPWSGTVKVKIAPDVPGRTFKVKVRVPGWARGKPVPSDLYTQTQPATFAYAGPGRLENGYLVFEKAWRKGDTFTVDFPMPVKRVRAHANVAANKGRLAVERGPIMYCAEGADNPGGAFDARLPATATFADTSITIGDRTFPALKASNGLVLIPYFAWNHRQVGNDMQVWLKE